MKYAWIDAHRKVFELVELCNAMAVSAIGYRSGTRGGSPAAHTAGRCADAEADPGHPPGAEGHLR